MCNLEWLLLLLDSPSPNPNPIRSSSPNPSAHGSANKTRYNNAANNNIFVHLSLSANAELIYRVLMLQETVGRALKLSQEAAARMEELQIQLSVLQRQCTYRDRPLCDTLRIRSFEENGVVDALKTVSSCQSAPLYCVPHWALKDTLAESPKICNIHGDHVIESYSKDCFNMCYLFKRPSLVSQVLSKGIPQTAFPQSQPSFLVERINNLYSDFLFSSHISLGPHCFSNSNRHISFPGQRHDDIADNLSAARGPEHLPYALLGRN